MRGNMISGSYIEDRYTEYFVLKNQIGLSSLEVVQYFYSSILDELKQAGYDSQEIALLGDTKFYYGRYLNPRLRNYFNQTVIPYIACAISYLLINRSNQYIIDLGCGLGMQSIIFASLGAKVVALDISEEAISLCKKRKFYYEKKLNIDLDIEFIHRDFRLSHQNEFNFKFDGLFSMSAFSYITPLDRTVKLISSILKDDARIFLYEKNSTNLLNSIRGSKEPSPENTINAFKREGFNKCSIYGGCSLPSFFWKFHFLNQLVLHPLNNLLRKSIYLSFNYVLSMKRGAI